jgi:hypothetical protein
VYVRVMVTVMMMEKGRRWSWSSARIEKYIAAPASGGEYRPPTLNPPDPALHRLTDEGLARGQPARVTSSSAM